MSACYRCCVLGILLLAAAARAQDTGGSFGGGDFGDSGGGGSDFGSSSGGSDWGSSGGSDYGSSGSYGGSYSGGHSSGGGDAAGMFCALLMIFGFIGAFALAGYFKAQRGMRGAPRGGGGTQIDLTALAFAIDWRARKKIQSELTGLARQYSAATPQGRFVLVKRTAHLLADAQASWLYSAAVCLRPMSPPQAEGTFRQLAIQARSRFKREIVRRAEGAIVEQQAGAMRARAEEGEGVVVVTFIVAARRELMDLRDPSDSGELRMALAQMHAFADQGAIAALEVVWSPAVEEDRMSTAELEALYPEMRRISGAAQFGRITCPHCHGIFPGELGRCPHCGAPRVTG